MTVQKRAGKRAGLPARKSRERPASIELFGPDIGPSDLSNLTRCKLTALEWAAQSAAPRSRKKIRVMGERDIISATALFAFYDEVSH